MPPAPRAERISYGPRREPGVRANLCGLYGPGGSADEITLEGRRSDDLTPAILLSLPEIWIVKDCWTCSSLAIILPSNVDGHFGALDLPGLDLANPRGTPVGDPGTPSPDWCAATRVANAAPAEASRPPVVGVAVTQLDSET